MKLAMTYAEQARSLGEVPVGCVIVQQNKVIAGAHNMNICNCDATAHGEMIAIKQANIFLQQRYLDSCDVYVTLEPCPMCAWALSLARVRRIYFGAYDIKGGGIDHGPQLYRSNFTGHKPEVYGGIMEAQCSKYLTEFFASKR